MKIVLTGGGTGGHFYPLIAVAQRIHDIARDEKLVDVEMFYLSDAPYDARLLFENHLTFQKVDAGKMRRYFSIRNIFDGFKTAIGLVRAVLAVYRLYPDVVFGKGGYASVPTLFAARLLGIPVVIHESDAVPGRANLWAAKFARVIAVAYPEVASQFPKDKVVVVGTPIRKELLLPITNNAREFLKVPEGIPVIFVVGGSQGAERINDAILDVLPELVKKYSIIHQTGKNNAATVSQRAGVILHENEYKERYIPYAHLDETHMRTVAGVAELVITRAGSSLFEIAQWKIPSIVIPIPESISRDQRTNAFTYARTGAAVVIEENNLTPHILLSEIDRIMSDTALQSEMRKAAASFARPDAAEKIARILIGFGLEHESR